VRQLLLFDAPIAQSTLDAAAVEATTGIRLPSTPAEVERQLDEDVAQVRDNFRAALGVTRTGDGGGAGVNGGNTRLASMLADSIERAVAHFRNCCRLLYYHRTEVGDTPLACGVVHFVADSNKSTAVLADEQALALLVGRAPPQRQVAASTGGGGSSGGDGVSSVGSCTTVVCPETTHWTLLQPPSIDAVTARIEQALRAYEAPKA
jgi:hypothetical protein